MPHTRQQVIDGLRELAQFLEDHPDLPTPRYSGATVSAHTTHDCEIDREDRDASRAAVDAAAAILGSPVADDTHYVTSRQFSAVTYQVVYVPPASVASWDALTSYSDNLKVAS